ncbi:hypothetical protein T5B8_16219 [Salinisphaera sp. T5B8]|uniref:polymorphic toxin type 44 domain-containing protein n=1 Tax=Salinisphaera sp. T5B8 TaxID=1304154 RepID=UPI003340CB4D
MDEFGNFHFGYVARAHGLTLGKIVAGAGFYQAFMQVGGSKMQAMPGVEIMWISFGGSTLPNSVVRDLTKNGFGWGDNPGGSVNVMNGWDSCSGC